MTNKDIVFWTLVMIFLIMGIFTLFTNFDILVYYGIIFGTFAILCLFKKFSSKFNNWLEEEI